MWRVRFGVLGPVAVWTDAGLPVAVPGRKVRALLADLLVHAGRPVPADRLIDDIWGERPPPSAHATLLAKMSQLRRALEDAEPGGRELVVSGPAGYALRAAPDAVDARRFSALTAQARGAEPRAAVALLTEALGLWRGPALADFADAPFARSFVAHLADQQVAAQEDAAELRLELGQHAELAGELAALVAEHPLRERLRGCTLRALYRAGRQTEALASYQDLRTRLADELGLDPSPELAALHQAILTRDPALDPSPPTTDGRRGNLPAARTELVGRDNAVIDVRKLIAGDRLVTLTGPGGVGKTRLALAAAETAADEFDDGAWLVELAAAGRPDDPDVLGSLAEATLSALNVRVTTHPAQRTPPPERLADVLRPRNLLLVLDNCEQIIQHVADLVDLLLRAAPDLRILTTSREPLALAGEVVWSVPPLDVPEQGTDDPALVADSSAARLFVARAAAAAPSFRLDADTAAAVAVLCRRLDGIPLALELAATRVRALGLDDVVARLDDRFRLLGTGHRGVPARQQTLRAVIDWSWELLTGPEQILLRRLAVHTGGATADAAAAVSADDDLPARDVPDLLARLVDRSLVEVTTGAGRRFRLLESVAEYSLGKLHDAGEDDVLRRRHADHYLALAEETAAGLHGPEQPHRLALLDAETANLRAALAASDSERALRLVYAVDREVGRQVLGIFPELIDSARADRAFLVRAVTHLVRDVGIRQLLDIGTGLPTVNNIHQVAQAIARDSRIVYVDNDPMVLAHARASLVSTPEGTTSYLHADVHDWEGILRGARDTLDFERPVALMLLGTMNYVLDDDAAYGIVSGLVDALPSDSCLTMSHPTAEVHGEAIEESVAHYNASGAPPIKTRSRAELTRFFDGLELLDPGIVSCSFWRPEPNDVGRHTEVTQYCGVARKR